jgi:hypothetical protein
VSYFFLGSGCCFASRSRALSAAHVSSSASISRAVSMKRRDCSLSSGLGPAPKKAVARLWLAMSRKDDKNACNNLGD